MALPSVVVRGVAILVLHVFDQLLFRELMESYSPLHPPDLRQVGLTWAMLGSPGLRYVAVLLLMR